MDGGGIAHQSNFVSHTLSDSLNSTLGVAMRGVSFKVVLRFVSFNPYFTFVI